jgi:hypothetical protein
MKAWGRKQELYAALPVADKLESKRRELEQVGADWHDRQNEQLPAGYVSYDVRLGHDELWHTYRARCVALEILALEGASAELVEIAWDRANEDVRFHRLQRPIPSPEEVAEIIEAQRACIARTEPSSPPPRQRRANVIEFEGYRDRLADYRGRDGPRTEPALV